MATTFDTNCFIAENMAGETLPEESTRKATSSDRVLNEHVLAPDARVVAVKPWGHDATQRPL